MYVHTVWRRAKIWHVYVRRCEVALHGSTAPCGEGYNDHQSPCWDWSPTVRLSLCFNGHFPGEPGLASFIGAKDDGDGGDNWSWAKLQSNRHHQQTNTKLFTGRLPFLSPNQQCQSTEGKIHIPWTCSTQAHLGSSNYVTTVSFYLILQNNWRREQTSVQKAVCRLLVAVTTPQDLQWNRRHVQQNHKY